MRLKDLHLKLKGIRLNRFPIGDGGSKKRWQKIPMPPWLALLHGYHVLEDQPFVSGSAEPEPDSVVVHTQKIEELQLWFFGVSEGQVGDEVTKYVRSHLLDRNPKESQIRRKSKEAMRKAYHGARAKIRDAQKADEPWRAGSVSVLVINTGDLVMASMGNYRAVVCRAAMAHEIGSRGQKSAKRYWSRRLVSVRKYLGKIACNKQSKGPEILVGAEIIDSPTEFVILASTGIWEVMNDQEAVLLIRDIDDPRIAAEYLANEALNRRSKSRISCLIIRFN
ncbi:putative protein phosphatase 2C-like protein 44 [Corylus avellana]|uniref:putative protein phosphatase 2C-like protein 44 n=1 Tax=Corylus avellana TaxID=13451 RepID=UPI00286AA82C|nr:putative protein phosphatase 2C-like protein 44 [Corylus avellana]